MFKAIADGFNWLFQMLATLFSKLMNGLLWLLQPLFDLLGIIFEFIYYIGLLIVKVVFLVITLGKLMIGVITGLFKTIVGLGYTGRTSALPSSYMEVYPHIQPYLHKLQIDKIAYILQFTIWFATAFIAIKLIGSMRGGGGSE